jgi:(2R)-sulfolactate sulfo-lyase subunit alpha
MNGRQRLDAGSCRAARLRDWGGEREGFGMSRPHLLVHERKDTVGVVVVENLKAGTDMLAVVTHDNSSFRITAKADIPIGHKVALKDIAAGETIWKYGQDIGVARAAIGKGEHLHVHNVKTKRW